MKRMMMQGLFAFFIAGIAGAQEPSLSSGGTSTGEISEAKPDEEIVIVEGLTFNKRTKLHHWRKEGTSPVVPKGLQTKEELLEFVMNDSRFVRAMWLLKAIEVIEEARNYVKMQVASGNMTTKLYTSYREQSLFVGMVYASPHEKDSLMLLELVIWAGDHELVCWLIPTSIGDIVIPIRCGNVARTQYTLTANVENWCRDQPWQTEEKERIDTGDKIRIRLWLFRYAVDAEGRKVEGAPLCDDFEHWIEVSKTFVDREVLVEKSPQIIKEPCEICKDPRFAGKTWEKVGIYWPKMSKAPKVDLEKLLAPDSNFWLTGDTDSRRQAREKAIEALCQHPDFKKLRWDDKTKRFRRKVQLAFMIHDVCTDEVQLLLYWEGWHWREYWIGFLSGFGAGFVTGWYARGEDVRVLTKQFVQGPNALRPSMGSIANMPSATATQGVGNSLTPALWKGKTNLLRILEEALKTP